MAVATVLLAGCAGGETDGPAPATAPREITVAAAASLTDVFGEVKSRFEAAHPGVTVRFSFGASSDLSSQIIAGAPVDVFASASPVLMQKVADAGLVAGASELFVTNRLQIAVQPGNPKGITGFADLNKAGVVLVVCAPQVPCGAATEKVEKTTGVRLTPASEEPDVRSVLAKVTSGNADAGLVYVTDVASTGGKVAGIDFPESAGAINDYPIAVLKNAPAPEPARAFVDYVLGDEAGLVFTEAGFGTP
jgi:molybdate transport system substrate-binding protein